MFEDTNGKYNSQENEELTINLIVYLISPNYQLFAAHTHTFKHSLCLILNTSLYLGNSEFPFKEFI